MSMGRSESASRFRPTSKQVQPWEGTMKKIWLTAILVAASVCTTPHAAVVSIDALQTGGFYADGSADNTPGFQNYFVGYGTTPGFGRTPERRSFFWFSLAGISEP